MKRVISVGRFSRDWGDEESDCLLDGHRVHDGLDHGGGDRALVLVVLVLETHVVG
jgi:hypothetical protein